MSDRLKALREERGVIVTQMQALTTLAETEKRELTNEEFAKHTELFDAADAKRKAITVEERKLDLAREDATRLAAEAEERAKKAREQGVDPANVESDEVRAARMKAFRSYLLNGASGLNADEQRALAVTPNTAGGYLLAPADFVAQLIMAMDNAVFIRAKATKFRVASSNGLGAPALDNDPADADWTTEILTGSEDSTMSFGKRELKPHPLAKLIKVSKTLLRTAAMPVEQMVMARLAYKFSISQEKGFLTGSGNQQPLGVFTASNDGISTGRDVSTGNTTTAITFDGLSEAKYSTKAGYWSKGEWLFHRDAVKMLTKLKDGEGQYLWRMSVREGEPDTILGNPLSVSEYAPSTFTTGLYVGLFGDFSNYWIADCLDFQVQVLRELYAATNQDGFIGRAELDGMPVLEEAFARVKLA
jgi:HK97 family phage major capsid protein